MSNTQERLEAGKEVDLITGCWRWKFGKDDCGYGIISYQGKMIRVHRLSAHLNLNLDLTSTKQANHKEFCKFRDCFNPDHLYVGSQCANINDSVKAKTHNQARKTHCPKGHEYDEKNTRIYGRERICRACDKERSRRRFVRR